MISPAVLAALQHRVQADEWAGIWITSRRPIGAAQCNAVYAELGERCVGALGHTSAHVVYWGEDQEFGLAWNNHSTETLYLPS